MGLGNTIVEKFHFVAVHIVISSVLFNYEVHGQTINSSCKQLSNSDIPTFCEEILDINSNTLYQDSLGNSSILESISSLEMKSPCLSLIKRYLCYLYYPKCSMESKNIVPFCSNSCKLLKIDDPVCSDLIFNVTSELKEIGLDFPKIECSKDNEETITPCLDLDNGSIITPVNTSQLHIECMPIPVDSACFSQLSHTYFAPNIFDNVDGLQKEFRTIILRLPTTNVCRGFLSSLSCFLAFPSCNSETNKLQPVCEHLCPAIDNLVNDCMSLVNFTTIPMLYLIFQQYNCSNASSYFLVPPEYIDTESCNAFIMFGPSTETNNVSSTMSSSRFPLGLSETSFIIAVVCTSAGVLLSCTIFSVCVAVAVCIKKKQKKKTHTIRDTMQNSIEVGIPSQYVQYLNQPEHVNKDVTNNDGVYRLLKEVETQFADCLIPPSSISKNKIIGKGEFGVVYRGHLINDENNSTQTVAIKTVRSLERWLSEAEDFMSESTIMAYFDHPNVLRMIGLSVDTDIFSIDIVLPYMINGDLRAFLKGQRVEQGNVSSYPEGLNEVALITMCTDIAKGMEYLASKRFVHRDLAARNCMVDENICVKVGDFGLAKDIYSTEYYRMNSNTRVPVKWMSPESLLDGFFNEKTDVWSYGVTCWEVFSLGRLPYAGIENHQILRTLKNGYRLEKPELCSDKLYNSVIALCWEEAPTNRLTFRDIVQTLDQILTDADVHT